MTEAADAFVYRCLAATVPHWLVSPTNKSRVVHLPARDSDRQTPVCKSKGARWVRKPVGVFPPGYKPVCRDCRERLRYR